MADNTTLDAGSGGDVIATDDIGGVKYQIVKQAFGPLDTATLVTATVGLPSDVVKLVPGTGATNLGKAIDTAVGSTDTGVAMLAVHTGEASKLSVAEEDYDHLHVGELGGLFVEPEQHNHLDEFDSDTDWTVLGNDTINLLTTKKHLTGTDALTFDKTDGLANTVFAGIQKTITTVDMGELDLHDTVQTVCFLSSIALVDYVFIRIGTDATNYNEWRVDDGDLIAGEFTILGVAIGSASNTGITGNGVDWGAVSYIAVGVAFDAETNALSGIIFDQLGLFTGSHTTSSGGEIGDVAKNVNVKKWGSRNVTLNAGNSDTGTLRVVLASDQNFVHLEDVASADADAGIPAMARRTATPADTSNADLDYEMLQMDNGRLWVSAEVDTALPAGTNNIGDVDIITVLTGSGALNLGEIEDGAHTDGDLGVMALAIRDDALTAGALVNADLDYVPLRTNNDGALWTQTSAGNLGGCKFFNDIDLDENDIDVATGACTVYSIYGHNETAAELYLKMFNTNTVTMGVTVADLSIPIPANADSDGAGFVLPIPACGVAFGTALTVAVTTGTALDDNGAPGANDANVTIFFQD